MKEELEGARVGAALATVRSSRTCRVVEHIGLTKPWTSQTYVVREVREACCRCGTEEVRAVEVSWHDE